LSGGAAAAGWLGAVAKAWASPLAADPSWWFVSATAPAPAETKAIAAAPLIMMPARDRFRGC
jgi:hypothetical protein